MTDDPLGRDVVLIVDDEPKIRQLIKTVLGRDGYRVEAAGNGTEMFRKLEEHDIDLVLLDVGIPGEDGFSLARKLRKISDVPIVMLTGRTDVVDKVVGLEIGADDYVTKPFHNRELSARIGSVIRRVRGSDNGAGAPGQDDHEIFRFGEWRFDVTGIKLSSQDGKQVVLTSREFQLLRALVERAGRVLTRDQILDLVADREWAPYDRSVDVTIAKIRKKLGDQPKDPQFIKTIRSIGYMFIGKVDFERADLTN